MHGQKAGGLFDGQVPSGAASTWKRIAPETRSQNTNAPARTGMPEIVLGVDVIARVIDSFSISANAVTAVKSLA